MSEVAFPLGSSGSPLHTIKSSSNLAGLLANDDVSVLYNGAAGAWKQHQHVHWVIQLFPLRACEGLSMHTMEDARCSAVWVSHC